MEATTKVREIPDTRLPQLIEQMNTRFRLSKSNSIYFGVVAFLALYGYSNYYSKVQLLLDLTAFLLSPTVIK